MKIKILGSHQHLNQTPIYDGHGRQTGSEEVPLLEIIAIPAGDNPQRSCMRVNIQIYAPDDAALLKFRPGAILELAEISTAAGEAANAAISAPVEPRPA